MKYISRTIVAVVSCFLLAEVSLVPVAAHALPEVAELRNTAEASGYPVIEESVDGSLYIYNPQEPVDRITQEQVPDEWISAVPSESETAKYVASEVGGPRGDASGVRDAIAGSGGVASAGKSPYHYHFNVVIWRDGSGSSAKARAHFRALNKNMKKTFPLGGMPRTVRTGATYKLRPGSNPVKVTAVGKDYFTLRSLPGHAEGAGKNVTFKIKYTKPNYVLSASANGPARAWQKKPMLKFGNKLFAYSLWSSFACRIRNDVLKRSCI